MGESTQQCLGCCGLKLKLNIQKVVVVISFSTCVLSSEESQKWTGQLVYTGGKRSSYLVTPWSDLFRGKQENLKRTEFQDLKQFLGRLQKGWGKV